MHRIRDDLPVANQESVDTVFDAHAIAVDRPFEIRDLAFDDFGTVDEVGPVRIFPEASRAAGDRVVAR